MLNKLYLKIDELNEEVEEKAQDVVQNTNEVEDIYEKYGMNKEELKKFVKEKAPISLMIKRVSGKRIKGEDNGIGYMGFKIEDNDITEGSIVIVFPGNDITFTYEYGIYKQFQGVIFRPGTIIIKGGMDIGDQTESEFEKQTLEFVYIIIPGGEFSGVKGLFHKKLIMGGDI